LVQNSEKSKVALDDILAVIPTYNGNSESLSRAISSIFRQRHCSVNVVIIDDCSDYPASPPIEHSGRYRYIKNTENLGLSGSLNKALELTNSDFLFVLADDIELLDDFYIKKALEHFKDPSVAIVSGRAIVRHDLAPAQRAFAKFGYLEYFPEEPVPTSYSLLKADLIRVSILRKLGGFSFSGDRRLGLEDQTTGYRINRNGYSVIIDPSIRYEVSFGRSEGLWDLLSKESLYGRTLGYSVVKRNVSIRAISSWDRLRIRYRTIQVGVTALLISSIIAGVLIAFPTIIQIPLVGVWLYHLLRGVRFQGIREILYFPLIGSLGALVFGLSFISGLIKAIFQEFTMIRSSKREKK
jgi:glycosyltransferase involved in cell wall biosynthesis